MKVWVVATCDVPGAGRFVRGFLYMVTPGVGELMVRRGWARPAKEGEARWH